MPVLKVKLDFEAIIRSEEFFRNILKAARLSETNESSFNLYCKNSKLYLTRPLKEQPDFSQRGISEEGIVYDLNGFGLYIPDDAKYVIVAHFHPSDNTAIPSGVDLENQLNRMYWNACLKRAKTICPIALVGHQEKRKDKIKLFWYQYIFRVDPFNLDPTHEHLSERLESTINQFLSDKYGELDFSDRNLPEKAAEILNQSEKIRAAVITFKTREEYDSELQKLKDFDLFLRE